MKKFVLAAATVITAALTSLPANAESNWYCRENPTDPSCSAARAARVERSYCRATDYMGEGCISVLRDRANRNTGSYDHGGGRRTGRGGRGGW